MTIESIPHVAVHKDEIYNIQTGIAFRRLHHADMSWWIICIPHYNLVHRQQLRIVTLNYVPPYIPI